ncbi:L-threonylcarbamoyladenylate synthase [Listeria sp. PSOL-1]|uniref:L-threonylcarbamoyladenylate synthase n=1 Tax=Listeria sp. PSOL-1 TaxID=1844999 RepID=UPI0013D81A85|nr:L-threonylcarbamoyladenylate synthase [Listeria sp. PSOL-1]
MKTRFWKMDPKNRNKTIYQEAAELLRQGEVIAFPTETVYGLGADATNPEAVSKIYQAKGRPADNPLIVHIASQKQMNFISEIPEKAKKLMGNFWPGPITIVLPVKSGILAENCTAGMDTVGVRIPEHPVSLALLHEVGLPIAAPSANSSGRPSPTNAQHVAEDLTGKIAGIIDGGDTNVGVESTVIDCTIATPAILRPGGISVEAIEAIIGKVQSAKDTLKKEEAPKAPGMKYTHYAPKAPVYLIDGSLAFFKDTYERLTLAGEKVGLLISKELATSWPEQSKTTIVIGSKENRTEIAQHLYAGLRAFDHTDVTIILAETYKRTEIGDAVMNRLEKAAGGNYLSESKK